MKPYAEPDFLLGASSWAWSRRSWSCGVMGSQSDGEDGHWGSYHQGDDQVVQGAMGMDTPESPPPWGWQTLRNQSLEWYRRSSLDLVDTHVKDQSPEPGTAEDRRKASVLFAGGVALVGQHSAWSGPGSRQADDMWGGPGNSLQDLDLYLKRWEATDKIWISKANQWSGPMWHLQKWRRMQFWARAGSASDQAAAGPGRAAHPRAVGWSPGASLCSAPWPPRVKRSRFRRRHSVVVRRAVSVRCISHFSSYRKRRASQ